MLRRLCTVLLVLACAFAPALPAFEAAAKSDDCGCGRSCCGTNDCAPPPATARATTTLTVVGAVEARAAVARPARRATSVRSVSIFRQISAQPGRASFAWRAIDAAVSAPLYRLHCTFLI